MWFIGKLSRSKRGAGSIIGGVFILLILLTGYTFYFLNVNVTEGYNKILQDMGELDLKRNKENLEFISVSFNNDQLNITVKNTDSYDAHLIWLGIFDETVTSNTQEYYEIDFYVDPAETVTNIRNETIPTFEGQERVIQLVTELGNTFSYSYPPSEEEDGARASVTITGENCTAAYNPSQWNLLGSTEHVSGSASNLTSNDGDYVVFRSYSSGSVTNITLLDDGFEGVDWDANWDNLDSDWYRDSEEKHKGNYSARSDWNDDGDFTCDDLDASDADAIYVDFWYRLDDTESNDLRLYYYDGFTYNEISRIGGGAEDTWLHYTDIVTDNQYFISNFRIRFRSNLGGDENVWVDDVLIKKQIVTEEQTAEVEFTGSSNLEDWTRLVWQIDSCWDIGEVTVTIQFYNYTLGNYAPSGNGYINYVSDATPNTDELKSKTITSNPTDFKNSTGHWRVKIKGVKSTSTQFQMKIDWIEFKPTYSSSGNSIPYNTWQWYTIKAATANGDPIPYTYISIYANGTSVAFRNATDKESVSNPGWVRLNADGEYQLEIKSTHTSAETFVLYAVAGSVVGQKTITQEAPG